MFQTKDGRRVEAIYTGNLYAVMVDEYAGSQYAKKVWVLSPGHPASYYRRVEQEIADNDGQVPESMMRRAVGK